MHLEEIGIGAVCDRICAGESQAEIAKSVGVSPAQLSTWLAQPENIERSARAREESAEAWLDRGFAKLAEALDKESGIDGAVAKAYEQACARRAALRNPRYADKIAHEISGDPSKPIAMISRIELVPLK